MAVSWNPGGVSALWVFWCSGVIVEKTEALCLSPVPGTPSQSWKWKGPPGQACFTLGFNPNVVLLPRLLLSRSRVGFFLLNIYFIYLKDRKIIKEKRDLLSVGSLPKWLQWLGLSRARARSRELGAGSLIQASFPVVGSRRLLFSRPMIRNWVAQRSRALHERSALRCSRRMQWLHVL